MLVQFVSPILMLMQVIHAMVGYVELGTDSWIGKITGNIMGEWALGRLLFVYTSALMFALRFFAGPLERVLTPLGLLFSCAVIAAVGLLLLGNVDGVALCLLAVTVYGLGKTFFWPTMLAVASERFPRGGAVVIGCVGGAGMLSAGLLGGPGIGFKQDYYASTELKKEAPQTYERYQNAEENTFLGVFHVRGLDGQKVAILRLATKKADTPEQAAANAKELATLLENSASFQFTERSLAALRAKQVPEAVLPTLESWKDKKFRSRDEFARELAQMFDKFLLSSLSVWWEKAAPFARTDIEPIEAADLHGGRMALIWTAAVPATMAVLYLLLLGYFKLQGGYKPVVLEGGGTELGTGES
jgi:hypothetical protein